MTSDNRDREQDEAHKTTDQDIGRIPSLGFWLGVRDELHARAKAKPDETVKQILKPDVSHDSLEAVNDNRTFYWDRIFPLAADSVSQPNEFSFSLVSQDKSFVMRIQSDGERIAVHPAVATKRKLATYAEWCLVAVFAGTSDDYLSEYLDTKLLHVRDQSALDQALHSSSEILGIGCVVQFDSQGIATASPNWPNTQDVRDLLSNGSLVIRMRR